MVKAVKGVLVQCDESIMAILIDIDNKHGNTFIQESLDDETCLVQTSKLNDFKHRLSEKLRDTVKEAEDSASE